MKNFRGKVAAITGAASGIGRALALDLAQRGCHLSLSDINADALQQTVEQARAHGIKATATVLNVADREAVYLWAESTAAEHGKVNLIFNNAGVALGGTVDEMSWEDLEWILGINLWGVVYGTKAFLPHLVASGEGHVINISSVLGLFALPTQSAYNITKFAVRGFTESLRQELDITGVSVSATCVHPGGIKTNIAKTARLSSRLAQTAPGGADGARELFERFFITSPEKAAAAILRAVQKNRRRVLVGPDAKVLDVCARWFPNGCHRLAAYMVRRTGTIRIGEPKTPVA